MDGVSWSTSRSPESFSRSSGSAADTLSRLASFITRAESKPPSRNQLSYVCQECGKGFPCTRDLLQHQELKHSLPKPHRCPSCGQEFSLRSSLQLHKCDGDPAQCELCHGASRLGSPCPACSARASDPGRLQDKSLLRQPHLLDGSPYACAPCGRGFNQKQALLHHQQAGCSEPPSSSDAADAGGLPDDSPSVSEGDSARSDSSDAPGPSGRAVNACRFCSRSFRSEAGLQRHEQTSHAETGQKASGDGGEARRGRKAKVNEEPNKKTKSKMKPLNCRSCDLVFRSTSKLHAHRKEKHSREKNTREPRPVAGKRRRVDAYPCQLCGKVFFHHLSLRAHYRHHTASSFNAVRNKSPSVGRSTKDSKQPETRPNKVQTGLADQSTVKAGPGTPRKASTVETKTGESGRYRQVPEVEEELEEEEEEEEEEEVEREFPCPSCAEVFSLQWQLKEHVELHQSSVRRRQCSVCTSEMDTCKWPGSRRHRLYHCVPCQQGFSVLDAFLEHCQEHLRVKVEEDSVLEGSVLEDSVLQGSVLEGSVLEGYSHQASKA